MILVFFARFSLGFLNLLLPFCLSFPLFVLKGGLPRFVVKTGSKADGQDFDGSEEEEVASKHSV